MGRTQLTHVFSWTQYSKKMLKNLEYPRSAGFFTQEDTEGRNLRLIEGRAGRLKEGNLVHFYWLVDEEDGIIADAKFQAFGYSSLIGMAETAIALMIGKNYYQAGRIGAELLDKELRDQAKIPAFPKEVNPLANLIVDAIDAAAYQCQDIPFSDYVSPLPGNSEEGETIYPGWETLSLKEKRAVIDEVLDREIRPYIAMDAGGIEIIGLEGDLLTIAYQGSCTSCYSATGATLSAIQQVLKMKVHPDLRVEPDMDTLQF